MTPEKNAERAVIVFDAKLYPKESVLKAASIFSDKFWVTLDGDPKGKMVATLTPKEPGNSVENLEGEFLNTILALIRR